MREFILNSISWRICKTKNSPIWSSNPIGGEFANVPFGDEQQAYVEASVIE